MSGRPMGGHNFDWKNHPEAEEYLVSICGGRLVDDIVAMMNDRFGYQFTKHQIRAAFRRLGVNTGLGSSKKGYHTFWTKDKLDFMATLTDRSYPEIIDEFERKYGKRLTMGAVGHAKWRNGIHSENDGRFEKGHKPENGYQKGHIPHSWKPVGSETRKVGRVMYVKVKDGYLAKQSELWRPKSHLIWEEHNGPVPEGHMIVYRDGDPDNLDISNLECISKKDNVVMNRFGYRFEGEYFETGKILANIASEVRRRKLEEKGNG